PCREARAIARGTSHCRRWAHTCDASHGPIPEPPERSPGRCSVLACRFAQHGERRRGGGVVLHGSPPVIDDGGTLDLSASPSLRRPWGKPEGRPDSRGIALAESQGR